MKRILRLTIYRRYFDEIVSGLKTIEYRKIKPYWISRLEGKSFDEIHFRNGYTNNRPFIRVKCLGISKHKHYEIHLGKILEVSD